MPKKTFNKASRTYNDYAQPQRWAAAHLAKEFPKDLPVNRVVELGCGTGLLTHLLSHRYPHSSILAIDAAEGMIQAAQDRPGLEDVQWMVSNIETAAIPQETDVVVSGCTFHWLDNLPAFFSHLRTSVREGTPLIFSIMLQGTVAEVRNVRRKVMPDCPEPEDLPSLESVLSACSDAGWIIEKQEELPYCTQFTSAWDLLQSLQRTGVTGGRYGTKDKPLYRGDLRKLMDELTRIYGQHQDGIPLHYQVGFLTCKAGSVPVSG